MAQWTAQWAAWAADYGGYRCGALRDTLRHREWGLGAAHAASHATDLVPLPRVAPLLLLSADAADSAAAADAALGCAEQPRNEQQRNRHGSISAPFRKSVRVRSPRRNI